VGDAAKDLIEVTGDATLTGTLNLAELGTLTPDTWYTVLTTTGTITDNLTLADPANWAKQVVDSNILQVKKTSGALVGYASWAGGHAFDSFNTEGVAYGMAWILGAATNSSPSIGLLPKVLNANGSGFTLHLTRVLDAGTAHLYLEYSDTLTPGSWTSIEVPVATGTVSGVVVTVGTSGGLYDITAQIPLGSTGKRFARLAATE
ncbi:MAG: hypothetical protein NTW21_03130, partial [Verrucomicrobia bacterium]|nr:hypothetical protein [Verrucomicrobiota bacterium]